MDMTREIAALIAALRIRRDNALHAALESEAKGDAAEVDAVKALHYTVAKIDIARAESFKLALEDVMDILGEFAPQPAPFATVEEVEAATHQWGCMCPECGNERGEVER